MEEDPEENPKKDYEEDPKEDPEEDLKEDFEEDPQEKLVEIEDLEESTLIIDTFESVEYFERNKGKRLTRKRKQVRKRPFRLKAYKGEKKHNFASLVIPKLAKTWEDIDEILSLLRKLLTESKHLA